MGSLKESRRQQAWIGDAILAAHVRTWCVDNLGPANAVANVIGSNINLAAYSREILMEPGWGGTEFEAYLFRLRQKFGEEAAKELVYSLCVWTVARLHGKHYITRREQRIDDVLSGAVTLEDSSAAIVLSRLLDPPLDLELNDCEKD